MSSFNQTPTPAPVRRGWFRRNWLWFLPSMVVLMALVCAGVCAGIFTTVFYALKSTEPYQTALAAVQKNPQVIERLGQPVEEVRWPPPSGSVHVQNGGGSANLVFNVKGPKGEAQVRTEARRTRGQWETHVLEVTFADEKRITIEVGGGGEEAPPFSPQGGGQAPKFAPKSGEKSPPPKPPASPTPEIHLDLPDLGPPEKGK